MAPNVTPPPAPRASIPIPSFSSLIQLITLAALAWMGYLHFYAKPATPQPPTLHDPKTVALGQAYESALPAISRKALLDTSRAPWSTLGEARDYSRKAFTQAQQDAAMAIAADMKTRFGEKWDEKLTPAKEAELRAYFADLAEPGK